ncbi:helix-turn-helix domain-containing protein, partial [Ruminococcaceae bacterium OttesenSCG-928-D13]|nr:helix-turn-helix domain-containing protein [Ruminococcaceae bacterium OttesenSCG-928-D13]
MEKNASIEKGIQVLQALNVPPYMFKIGDICAKTGLNRTIVYRILATYEAYDIVTRDDVTGRYKVGPGLYQLGIKFIVNSNYRGQMEKLLDEIAGITKESVGMA